MVAGQPHRTASSAMDVDSKQKTRSLRRKTSAISCGEAGQVLVMRVHRAASSWRSSSAAACRPGYISQPWRCSSCGLSRLWKMELSMGGMNRTCSGFSPAGSRCCV